MVIEKVFSHNSTSITLNKRFTILAKKNHFNNRQRRRSGYLNRNIIDALLLRLGLEQEMYTPSVQSRLSVQRGNLRRFGSESYLPGMWRSNSYGNLSQSSQRASVKSRLSWTQSNGNLQRSASFGNLSGIDSIRSWRSANNQRRNQGRKQTPRNTFNKDGWGNPGGQQGQQRQQGQRRQQGQARGRGQSADRVKGGGAQRKQQQPKQLPTKEELDEQLDQYMSCTKFALDKEIEEYMSAAENVAGMDVD